jgi:hypothetical protein
MLFWPAHPSSKSKIPQGFKGLFAAFIAMVLVNPASSQTLQGVARETSTNMVTCYKSAIKEPLTFYGNPMDTFTLYDGTKWKVSSGGAYEYIPVRYRNVLICPSEELLVIDKKAISVSKLNQ